MPVPEDAVTANISSKDNKVEDLCISDIVFGVRSFFIKSSRFSYMRGGNIIGAWYFLHNF